MFAFGLLCLGLCIIGLMAPSKASDGKNAGEASVAGESSGPTTTTRSDNDDEDFISEEALLRIIELVANDAVSEGETSCGEPGMMRQAAHRHRENMSVHHIDFYSVILYLALHVYQCSLRDLVGTWRPVDCFDACCWVCSEYRTL